jgi:hypothetical protein
MAHRLEITLSDEQWARLNEARGHEARASFVKRALEKALSEAQGQSGPSRPARVPVDPAATGSARPAASARTSVDPALDALPLARPVSAARKASIQETWAR